MYRVLDNAVQSFVIYYLECRFQISLLDAHCVYDLVLLVLNEVVTDFETAALLRLKF